MYQSNKSKLLILSVLVSLSGVASADSYTDALRRIVDSNPTIAAAEATTNAAKAENHTGLTLENPELEASYEWGNPAGVPNRTIVSLSQGFDFATLSGGKKRVAKAADRVADAELLGQRRAATAEVDALMTEIVYRRRMKAFLERQHALYDTIRAATARAMEAGEMTLIDLNTIKLAHNEFMTELRLNEVELEGLLRSLAICSGGKAIAWTSDDYMEYELPSNFETWVGESVASSAEVEAAAAALSLADKQLSLSKSEGLPSFSLGYTNELVHDANYFGFAVGVELPLWANRGKVKAAKAARTAAELQEVSARQQFTLVQQQLYNRALALRAMAAESRTLRDDCDITASLEKMFAAGELSVHDYMSQIEPLLELDRKVLEADFEYQQALVSFRAADQRFF